MLGCDLVAMVTAVGPQVDESLVGRRVATVVKTGGRKTHALADAGHLVSVPDGLDAADTETVVVNGITAWQMLPKRVRSGPTVLVHGANGGVGNTLVQLARHAGIRVIGTASSRHHETLRAMGAEPIGYNDPQLSDHVEQLAPGGVDAVFGHIGGSSFRDSFRLLARGGTLASGSFLPFLGRKAHPSGPNLATPGLCPQLRGFAALRRCHHSPYPAPIPLAEARRAMKLAESRTVHGNVVLVT